MDNYARDQKMSEYEERYNRLYRDGQQLVYERDKLLQKIKELKLFKEDYAIKIKKANDFFEQKQQAINKLNGLISTVKIFEQFKNYFNDQVKFQEISNIQSQNQALLKQVDRDIYEKEERIRRIDNKLDEVDYLMKQINIQMRNL